MVEHVFGGEWTREKLDMLRAYLIEYRRIFDKNPGAKFLTPCYIDAFAGTGTHSFSPQLSSGTLPLLADEDADEEKGQLLEGSAKIALDLSSPFHKYLFIEKAKIKPVPSGT